MEPNELHKLQRYIGKRIHDQSDEQVIEHINKINRRTPITENEWNQLLFPACANADIPIVKYILSNMKEFDDMQEFMIHTVRSQEHRYEYIQKRIEALKILIQYLPDIEKERILSETLLIAGWYGELGVMKYLIEQGADIHYKGKQGKDAYEFAKIYSERFKDDMCYQYLTDYYERGVSLKDIESYYSLNSKKKRWKK